MRLVDVVTLRTDALREDGLMIVSQKKNEQPVFVPLPAVVVDLVRKLPPKSSQYFFWTGTSTMKTAVNDWSEKDSAALRGGRYRAKAHSRMPGHPCHRGA